MSARNPQVLPFVLVWVLPALISCTGPDTSAEITRLATRIDSLAVTVAAMKAVMQGGALTSPADTVTVATSGSAVLGSESAPVTIVEFTDYQCPFCARHARSTLPGLIREFVNQGTVRYVIRDLPLEMHPLAMPSAMAARCASRQGAKQYWHYHDALFQAQPQLAESSFVGIARNLGLDLPRFEACLGSPAVAAMVEQDVAGAAEAGLTGTPSFVIGRAEDGSVTGVVVRGAHPLTHFREAIELSLRAQRP